MLADNSQNIWNPKVIDTGLNNEVDSYGLENDDLKEIAFVDSQLSNYQSLIDGFDENVLVFLLDGSENGLNQITQTLENYQNLDAIHLLSHGVAGGVQLGDFLLTQDNLGTYQNQLQAWGNAFTADGDLLFYGCNVAEGTIGQEFLQDVSGLTGADVAGSDDLTGNVAYGGDDWHLEYSTGDIEAQSLRGNSSFTEVLGTVSLSNDGKLTFDEGIGIGIANSLSLSVIDGGASLLIKDNDNSLTAGSNLNTVSDNEVKVDLSTIKDIEFKLGFGKDSLSFDSEISFANGQLSSFIIEGEENTLPGLDLVLGDLFGDSVNFNHNLYLGGANLNVSAENITVKENATISTRQVASGENHLTANSTGDSGNIKFTGDVTIGSEDSSAEFARILTNANDSKKAGNIDIESKAIGTFSPALGFFNNDVSKAKIIINKAEIKAGDINILTSADNSSIFDSDDPKFLKTVEPIIRYLESFSLLAGVARVKSEATITFGKDSNIVANNLEAQALATSLAKTAPISLGLGIGVGIIDSKSKVLLEGKIQTEGNLSILAKNDNSVNVVAQSDPIVGGFTAAAAITVVDSDAKATIANSANLTVGGDFNVLAKTNSTNTTSAASAASQKDDGKVAFAIALADEENETQALVDGIVNVTGSINISAEQKRTAGGVNAAAGVNNGEKRENILDKYKETQNSINNPLGKLTEEVNKKLKESTKNLAKKTDGKGSSIGLAGGVAIADFVNSATARIGTNAKVTSQENISINGKVSSRPNIKATSSVSKPEESEDSGTPNENKFAGSAAVAVGDYNNIAKAYID